MPTHHRHTRHIRKVHLARYLIVAAVFLTGAWSAVHLVDRYSAQVLPYSTEMSHDSLLQATNLERSESGAGLLYLNARLSQAAQLKANDMASRNYWSHDTPEGNPPWVFINQAGYVYMKAGENLAYGFTTSRATVTGWMNSPKHKENMLDPLFTEVGFGYANSSSYQKSGKQTIVVAMYGLPALSNAAMTSPGQSSGSISGTLQGAASPTEDPALRFSANGPVGNPAGVATFNTPDTPEPKAVSRVQTFFGSSVTLSTTLIIAFVAILAGAYVAKHVYSIRRIVVHGEQFILHHPLLDISLLALITFGYIITRAAGYIQ